ncbi:MAG TPA: hypothetical protein PK111_04960 [Atribacterota bacterium]|mgnify:CR=1 FL=1|nr:hypothetical protein [Atribacterota bacterium]
MLKKIVKELEEVEKEAENTIEKAQNDAQKAIQEEINQQEEIRKKLIAELNKKGRELVDAKINNALSEAEEIYEESVRERKIIEQNTMNKFEKAVQMILNQIVK